MMRLDDDDGPGGGGSDGLRRRLETVVAEARTLGEIEGWLRAQPGIAGVASEDYLIKTHPPRRVIAFEVGGGEGRGGRWELVVVEQFDGGYGFRELRQG